jgi:curli production assembly/transport component CsgG
MKATFINCLFLGVLLILLQGCSQYLSQPMRVSKARLGAETPQFKELVALPDPKEKIVAAVYKFRDQTGQYKDTDIGSSWSTAVTQGATSILLRAMEESGWFIPIEREGLSNLLNERKIIRSSMANYSEQDNNQLLPPLVFAGVIMEGGIISFDSNIMTGGVGARYFGSGASGEYREDRVTIYLRAVSTSNGRILKTVYTSKTILSQQIDVGVFRFVSTRRLLEAETGFTYNEPGEMAVKEAIEKAVFSLVVEGINDQLWQVKNETDLNSDVVKKYISEKDENKNIDAFGNVFTARRSSFGFGVKGSGLMFEGDYNGSQVFPGGELNFEFLANRPLSIGISTGLWKSGTGEDFNVTIGYADVGLKYRFFNELKTTPYVRLGTGIASEITNSIDPDTSGNFYPQVTTEFGMEFLVTNKLGINASVNYHFFFSDELDRLTQGKFDDSIWGGNIGVMFYLFK